MYKYNFHQVSQKYKELHSLNQQNGNHAWEQRAMLELSALDKYQVYQQRPTLNHPSTYQLPAHPDPLGV